MRGKPVPKKYQNFKADLKREDVVEDKNLNQNEKENVEHEA